MTFYTIRFIFLPRKNYCVFRREQELNMEREYIATSKVHEIVVLATPPDTAKAAAQSILQEVIKYPHIRITHATGAKQ